MNNNYQVELMKQMENLQQSIQEQGQATQGQMNFIQESPKKSPYHYGILRLEKYSPLSFVVRGGSDENATRGYVKQLRDELGGTLNYRLKESFDPNVKFTGYIFSNKKLKEVTEFVEKVNRGEIQASDPPARDESKQRVFYNLDKPSQGQIMIARVHNSQTNTIDTHKFNVLSLETIGSYGTVMRFYVQPLQGGEQFKVVICDGKWQIWGIFDKHDIEFRDSVATPEKLQKPISSSVNHLPGLSDNNGIYETNSPPSQSPLRNNYSPNNQITGNAEVMVPVPFNDKKEEEDDKRNFPTAPE